MAEFTCPSDGRPCDNVEHVCMQEWNSILLPLKRRCRRYVDQNQLLSAIQQAMIHFSNSFETGNFDKWSGTSAEGTQQ
jgi:hypothetical protein